MVLSDDEFRELMQQSYPASVYHGKAMELCALYQATPRGQADYIERVGLAKELQDEMLPLAFVCQYYFQESAEVDVQLCLGNQLGDARILDRRKGTERQYLAEVTVLERGDYRKRETIARDGLAWEFGSESELVAREYDLFRKAIKSKAAKGYPADSLLVVYSRIELQPPPRALMSGIPSLAREMNSELSAFGEVVYLGRNQLFLTFAKNGPLSSENGGRRLS